MTVGCANFGLAMYQGQLWAVGGRDEDLNALSCREYLDTVTNTWMAGPPMAISRQGHGLAVLNGYFWVVGGSDGGAAIFTSEYLEPLSNT